jgi:hypothetical protein
VNGPAMTGASSAQNATHGNITADNSHGCDFGYGRIDTYEACRSFADCESYCMNPDLFEVGIESGLANDPRPSWAADYNGMPRGCHIRSEDGCVYFNRPRSYEPTGPYGVPVCHIAQYATS